ncbi:PQQ-binding-like beta-propeller repeat protein [bacterium]|nr:PQQ-binding-like beta-propeller repeat protein [bacterium]
MKHTWFVWGALSALVLGGCSSHDPILPGTRTPIFDASTLNMLDTAVPNAPMDAPARGDGDCPYTQDASNVIWHGDKKIFSGFPTSNSVKSEQKPVCAGGHLYVGLTTGEVVKINQSTRQVTWVADVYRASNMTGGAALLDIVSPIIVDGGAVYVGGLGDAICRLRADSGARTWCVPIATAMPMIVAGGVVYVVATDNQVYAIRASDGAVYWRAPVKKQAAPTLSGGVITVGTHRLNAGTGEKVP